jgi:hypothetical protein
MAFTCFGSPVVLDMGAAEPSHRIGGFEFFRAGVEVF